MPTPRSTARHTWVSFPNETLACPHGHPDNGPPWQLATMATMGALVCQYRGPDGPCDGCVVWWLLPEGARLVAVVSLAELARIERESLDMLQSLAYLGLRSGPVR